MSAQVGMRAEIRDGAAKLTGALRFAGDETMAGLTHAALLLSPRAHARVVTLDASSALAVPGVLGVWWHENTPQNTYNSAIWYAGQAAPCDERMFPPELAHVGDRVAVVLAETEAAARRAAALIAVSYEDLPATLTARAASEAASETAAAPIACEALDHGDIDAAFARAPHISETRVTTPRSHHCAIEPHVCLAWPEDGGRIAIHSPCQSVFAVQAVVARALAVAQDALHVTKAPIGGSFGGKAEPILEPICAFLARAARRPVRLQLSRHETFTASRTRAATAGRMRIALDADGRILGRDTDVTIDVGAYCTGGHFLPGAMLQRLVRLYDVPAERYRGRAVLTNTLPAGAFRGYGSPQIHTLGEIALDFAAREAGFDPVAVRLRNIVRPGAVDPWQGLELGNARGADCLRRGADAFGWARRRAAATGAGRFRRGVGMAAATHINGCYPGDEEVTTARLHLMPDGGVRLVCALHDLGCGSDTTLAQIAAEVLGLMASDIRIAPADSDTCAYDLGTRASRMTYVAGEAVRLSALALADALCRAAAPALNSAPEGVRLKSGCVVSDDSELPLAGLAAWLNARGAALPEATHTHRSSANPGSYAAH